MIRPVALPGFCNRGGGSEVWVCRGSRVRSPPVPVVLSVYQRGSLLDDLAMYLSCETKKFHDNESTHILHNFGRPPIAGEASPFPPGGATGLEVQNRRARHAPLCPVVNASGERAHYSIGVLISLSWVDPAHYVRRGQATSGQGRGPKGQSARPRAGWGYWGRGSQPPWQGC